MLQVHKTNWLTRLGEAVLILCSGTNGTQRVVEQHILFPHTRRQRIFGTLALGANIPEEMAAENALDLARNHLQARADIANRQLFPHEPFAAPVELLPASENVLRLLWMSGFCSEDLRQVHQQTGSVELSEFLERIQRWPVIGRHPADVATVQ